MVYYARSENDYGNKETVAHHLNRCGELAGDFASSFGKRNDGELIGKLHDVGKYSVLFQEVLERKAYHINHTAAGAYFMMNLRKRHSCAELLSCVVYAHHGILRYGIENELKLSITDKGSGDGTRQFSVSGKEQYVECYNIFTNEIILPDSFSEPTDFTRYKKDCIGKMLYMRMMLSCLVDADYSSSAEHFNPQYLKKVTAPPLETDKIIDLLTKYRDRIICASDSNKAINDIRNEVYTSCTSVGKTSETGLYTLTAPTGSGKTLALLSFALNHAKQNHKERIIIVLPFLSIIEQNAAQYREICGDILEAHSLAETILDTNEEELLADFTARWSSPIIVTTAVTFFETLFKASPNDLRRLHHFANSVIVFDEAQSLPCDVAGATVDTLNGLCRDYNSTVLFSTATQPAFDYRCDMIWNPTEICSDPQRLFKKSERVEVEWRISGNQKTPLEKITAEMMQQNSCCAILNSKKHAKKLHSLLKEHNAGEGLFHISSDMCTAHRKNVVSQIKKRLAAGLSCRIVSTQCIEAGVDLDVDVVFRALAPLEAIIQSAGRCNRGAKKPRGKVIVFVPDEEDTLYPTTSYESAAKIIFTLLDRYGGKLDIDNLDVVREYYQLLFSDKKSARDKSQLTSAIDALDFAEVEKVYKLIDNRGAVNIIVPYMDKLQLYSELSEAIRERGITPGIMKDAASITISCYNVNAADKFCEKAYIKTKDGMIFSGWYILGIKEMYNEETGIDFGKDINTTI